MKISTMTDFQFAKYLRKHGAIDNWRHLSPTLNIWLNPQGQIVAIVSYDNRNNTKTTYTV